MPLHLYDDAHGLAGALAASSGQLYSICNRDRLEPSEVLRLERCAAENGHRDLLSDGSVRAEALQLVYTFFREAAQLDPGWRFAYSSKVVLSIPAYQDLQKIFLLHCRFAAEPRAEALLLVPEPRLLRLFAEIFGGARRSRDLAIPGARAWARFARTFLRAVLNRTARVSARVLFFTLSSGVPRAGADAYFGNLPESIASQMPTRTVYLASGPALRLPSPDARMPFEAFLSAPGVLSIWVRAFFSAIAEASPPAASADVFGALHRYLRAAEIHSGEYFMQRVLESGFGRMLARLAPEVLVFPYENRSWEKHLLAGARRHGIRRCVGYQHSSITPRHLAFRLERGELQDEHLPDRIVTIGEYTAALLENAAPALAGRTTIGASLRTARQAVTDAPLPAVLVAISSSRNEAMRLLQVTYDAATRVSVPFIVRTHPTIPVDSLFALFAWPSHVELSRETSLAEDLSRVTIVAYSSSTVAVEGMLYGRLPIFVDIGDLPSGDPIVGDYAFKRAVSDGGALAGAIEGLRRLEPARLRSLQEDARRFSESYLRAPTAEALRQTTEAVLRA